MNFKIQAIRLTLAAVLCCISMFANAVKGNVEKSGDIGLFALPLLAYSSTFYLEDEQGRNEFYKSILSTALVTQLLKVTVRKKRPIEDSYTSFPSGHAAIAFQSATFIEQRYGWKYGLPAFAAATYVGWTRVESKQHYTIDVLAGAAIGALTSLYFTTPYNGMQITPYAKNRSYGVEFSTTF
ncbi:MAG: phosphatase PAP2 family protein [Paraglaciecola polaris]|uniref:phosphatase PAP2 family protein n=1 Tax=Paraglaciecola polaris TaxID=222814 RepID=UPI003002C868